MTSKNKDYFLVRKSKTTGFHRLGATYRTLSCRTSSVYNLADLACHYLYSRNIIWHIKKGKNMAKNDHI